MRRRVFPLIRGIGRFVLLCGLACSPPSPRSFETQPLEGNWRIAILPLANYTQTRDASARMLPILATELGQLQGIHVVDPGAVEEVLAREPWLLLDRLPLDIVQRFGTELGADALLVGSILGSGYRQTVDEKIPHVSLSLRLLRVSDGDVLWSGVHARDGADSEWLFGLGRVRDFDQLVARTIREMVGTFPMTGVGADSSSAIVDRRR